MFGKKIVASSIVASSWERSRKYGIDPQDHQDAILEEASLLQRREIRQTLLHTIEPSIMNLFTWTRDMQSIAIVSDIDGYILNSIGDPGFLSKADKVHLREGACWSEPVRGTNAIGTAIAEQAPVSIVGNEHYCADNQFLCCSAAPIFAPTGEMIAVLDLSGYYEKYHPSQLALVDTTARNMEDWILMQTKEHQIVLSLISTATNGRRALIGINSDGQVIGANREARNLLQLQSLTGTISLQEITDGHNLLSTHLQTNPQPIRLNLNSGQSELVEASILLDRRSFTSSGKTLPQKPTDRSENCVSSGVSTQWQARYCFRDIFGTDTAFQTTLHLARRAAQTTYTVFVFGETGTGKEMVTQAIHNESARKEYPFVSLNCGAVSPTLIESELFGYEAGAFTGGKRGGSKGKFELAHHGTLFLDEIAEMPIDMQTKLLRVLQEGYIVRIGGSKPVPVDVRIIIATHKDLWDEVQAGRFRADLFFRLQGIQIALPPLRERSDLLELAHHLLPKIQMELNVSSLYLTTEVEQLLVEYPWPGNVRELESILREAAFLSERQTIDINHLPARVRHLTYLRKVSPTGSTTESDTTDLRQQEFQMILHTVEETGGNLSEAARLLGISRSTLYRKLQLARSKGN